MVKIFVVPGRLGVRLLDSPTIVWNRSCFVCCLVHMVPVPHHYLHLSLVMRKPAICICENKDADQLRGNREADQRLCFRYTDCTIHLLPKSEISSLYPSHVAVQPGLCGTWSETPKTGFPTTRLILLLTLQTPGSTDDILWLPISSGIDWRARDLHLSRNALYLSSLRLCFFKVLKRDLFVYCEAKKKICVFPVTSKKKK